MLPAESAESILRGLNESFVFPAIVMARDGSNKSTYVFSIHSHDHFGLSLINLREEDLCLSAVSPLFPLVIPHIRNNFPDLFVQLSFAYWEVNVAGHFGSFLCQKVR